MKRTILILILTVLLLLAACAKSTAEPPKAASEHVVEDIQKPAAEDISKPEEKPAAISPNGLMDGASPSTSALARYVWDGETVTRDFLFETPAVEEVLALLDEIPVTEAADWTPALVTAPIYGFEISDTNGWPLQAAWSNGYWITDDGRAYTFAFDMESLSEFHWREQDEFDTTTVLPCARILSRSEDGWYPALLTKAEEPEPPAGITLTIDSIVDGEITATFHNGGTETWTFGEYYGLEVKLDGVWYEVPTEGGGWAFHDIAYELASIESGTLTYNLAMYGDLPAGSYRLVANGLTAEFIVE